MEIFGVGGEVPEEIRQFITQQIDRQHMASTANYHTLFTLFDELSPEQIQTLGGIFNQLAREPHVAHYLEGICASYMRLKHDTCMGCGSSHTPNFEEGKKSDVPLEKIEIREVQLEQVSDEERIALYNLRSETVDGVVRFTCNGCGLQYVSLEDRMLKPVDECHGCQQKSKWG